VKSSVVKIAAGLYQIGSDSFYPEERPARTVATVAFGVDATPVTNAQFREFVMETGWVTTCERLQPRGSMVFRMTPGPVDLGDPKHWWMFVEDACWYAPKGPGSTLDGLDDHPVVHVSHDDALQFARWRGARLPTALEWEVAASGVGPPTAYAWGEALMPQDRLMANIWVGSFPWYYAGPAFDGPGTTPVGAFAPNDHGVFDMIGNVWEWTGGGAPAGALANLESLDGGNAEEQVAAGSACGCDTSTIAGSPDCSRTQQVLTLKGGSYLCAAEYCARYRPAALIRLGALSSGGHIGFRCAYSL